MRCSSFKIVKLFAVLDWNLLKNQQILFAYLFFIICCIDKFIFIVMYIFSNFPLLPDTMRTSAHFNNSGVIWKSLQRIVRSQFTIKCHTTEKKTNKYMDLCLWHFLFFLFYFLIVIVFNQNSVWSLA